LKPVSSTQEIPDVSAVPAHVAIIMDGNGRWAVNRHLPRTAGHVKGVGTVRKVVAYCLKKNVSHLTLFAFSSENWRRPEDEVSMLMRLFVQALDREVSQLNERGIRLRVVGDLAKFDSKLQGMIEQAQQTTAANDKLHLTIAANYGGRWDILQATRSMLKHSPELAKEPGSISEESLNPYLCMSWAPEPDLFIRTGGEQRVSNFLIWQLAYSELYFTDCLWPDFSESDLQVAFNWYQARERRFGRTSAQLPTKHSAA
jgi:undecaprenyl diphosphate synthase